VEEPSPCPLPGYRERGKKGEWLMRLGSLVDREEPSLCPLPEYRERGKRSARRAGPLNEEERREMGRGRGVVARD
jgi:hypothetical protein